MQYTIETKFKANVIFEANIAVGGYTYLLIYGKHINGNFICIPNWKVACEASRPTDTGYNTSKLIESGLAEEVAKALAMAIDDITKDL